MTTIANLAKFAGLAALASSTALAAQQPTLRELMQPIIQSLPPGERPAEIVQPIAEPAPVRLQSAIRALGASFPGQVGIAVRDVHDGWVAEHNARRPYPQQSVSKLWVAITMLDAVDRGAASLDQPVTIRQSDLTLFNQPIARLVGANGHRTTVRALLEAAMTQSDNTANDSLLRTAGGPAAVRSKLARHAVDLKFGPGERLLQAQTAGLTWRQSMSQGRAFQTARAMLPLSARESALNRYLADPIDGASPVGMVDALAKLHRRELLSPAMTDYLIATMRRSRTGPQRLKGGLASGWQLAHKTGTGQELGSRSTGYNDVGLITAPDGRTYAVAVMIGQTTRPIPERMRLMQAVTRAVIANHNASPASASLAGSR